MGKQKFHACHACGAKEPNDGSRFCTPGCEDEHTADHFAIRLSLLAQGFSQDAAAPNTWTKDGVSVTEEECYGHGIEKILARHQSVALNPAVPVTRKRK